MSENKQKIEGVFNAPEHIKLTPLGVAVSAEVSEAVAAEREAILKIVESLSIWELHPVAALPKKEDL